MFNPARPWNFARFLSENFSRQRWRLERGKAPGKDEDRSDTGMGEGAGGRLCFGAVLLPLFFFFGETSNAWVLRSSATEKVSVPRQAHGFFFFRVSSATEQVQVPVKRSGGWRFGGGKTPGKDEDRSDTGLGKGARGVLVLRCCLCFFLVIRLAHGLSLFLFS